MLKQWFCYFVLHKIGLKFLQRRTIRTESRVRTFHFIKKRVGGSYYQWGHHVTTIVRQACSHSLYTITHSCSNSYKLNRIKICSVACSRQARKMWIIEWPEPEVSICVQSGMNIKTKLYMLSLYLESCIRFRYIKYSHPGTDNFLHLFVKTFYYLAI